MPGVLIKRDIFDKMDPYAYIVFGRGLSRALTKLRLGPAISVTSPNYFILNVSPGEGGLSEI